MTIKINDNKYEVLTNEYLNMDMGSGVYVIRNANYYILNNNVKYYVDNKKVILDYSLHELEIAIWLVLFFGGKLYMLPKVNVPDGIKTSDYLLNGENWDLKEIKSIGKRAIDNRLNGSKRQARNFILDITENKLSDDDICKQIEKIYNAFNRNWINKIILYRGGKLITIFKRK